VANSVVALEAALGLGYGVAGGCNRLPSMANMAVGVAGNVFGLRRWAWIWSFSVLGECFGEMDEE
jgi:hypothetical protein